MKTQDLIEKKGPSEISESHIAIRKFLAMVATNWGLEVSPEKIKLWLARFEKMPVAKLSAAFTYCLDHCRAVPQFADVLAILHRGEEVAVTIEANSQWTQVLDALRWSPELRAKLKFPCLGNEKVRICLLGAGGESYVESCSRQELDWARRRFVEAWEKLADFETGANCLPASEAKELLERIRRSAKVLTP